MKKRILNEALLNKLSGKDPLIKGLTCHLVKSTEVVSNAIEKTDAVLNSTHIVNQPKQS